MDGDPARSRRQDLFATPLWTAVYEDAGPLNEALAVAVRDLRAANRTGGERSNTDSAWRSESKLFVEEPFAGLAQRIGAFAAGTVARDLRLKAGVRLELTELWANLTPPGGRHRLHHHGSAYLSGVYYVVAPKGSGGLTLHDPSPTRPILARYWELTSERTPLTEEAPTIEPRAGDLHIFPAWLGHEVGTNHSPDERISISFNLRAALG